MRAHRTSVALVALGVILVAAGVLAFAWPPSRSGSGSDAGPEFVVECTWSHRAPDDPIVHAGHAGASHLHDFFGSTETKADSTAASLLGTASTCQSLADTAAYWSPTLLDAGVPVDPGRLFAYYRVPTGVDADELVAHPFGLELVAGDAQARDAQPVDVVGWHCGASPDLSPIPPWCPRSAPLTLRLAFPSCWNGTDLDSTDHRAHVAYPTAAGCAPSHAVALPELVLDVSYSFWESPNDLSLASGPTYAAHGDFLNAWEPDVLAELVDSCLKRGQRCGVPPNRASIER